ncbi:MAG: hypothetical protein AB4057_10100 [Crocosphaera sp.]
MVALSLLTITHLFIKTNYALAETSEGSIIEDDLNTQNSLPWGLPDWRYSQVLNIHESLINLLVGKVVIDKYENRNGALSIFNNPPSPGKKNFISFWGSKIEGCFVKLIFQSASSSNPIDPETLIPIRLDMGVDDTIIKLRAKSSSNTTYWKENYTYGVDENKMTGTFYGVEQNFFISSEQVNHLKSASTQEVKARITFLDGSSVIYPIGVETVKRWKNVYSFNPYCKDMN